MLGLVQELQEVQQEELDEELEEELDEELEEELVEELEEELEVDQDFVAAKHTKNDLLFETDPNTSVSCRKTPQKRAFLRHTKKHDLSVSSVTHEQRQIERPKPPHETSHCPRLVVGLCKWSVNPFFLFFTASRGLTRKWPA